MRSAPPPPGRRAFISRAASCRSRRSRPSSRSTITAGMRTTWWMSVATAPCLSCGTTWPSSRARLLPSTAAPPHERTLAGAGRHAATLSGSARATRSSCSMAWRWTSNRWTMQDFVTLHRYCRFVAGGVGLMLGPVLGAAAGQLPRGRGASRHRDAAHQRAARRGRGPRQRAGLPAGR